MTSRSLLDFANAACEIGDLEELTRQARAAAAPFGVTAVSANLILSPGRRREPDILVGDDRWRDWAPRYRRERMSRFDPALRMMRTRNQPFTWSEARTRYASPQAEYVMEACRETTGFANAVVVPVREYDEVTLTAAFFSPEVDLDPAALNAFWLAGLAYAGRARDIVGRFELQPITPLSPREIQCLELVWRAKSNREIGLILGVSHRTVHNQVESAKRKMRIGKRTLAAQEAWRRGWIQ